MVNFTPEQKAKLADLTATLCFSGETFAGKFGSNEYNPWDFLNTSSPSTLESAYNAAKRAKNAAEKEDPWSASKTDSERVEQLKRWEEFLFLAWGWARFKMDSKTREADKSRKLAALNALKEENKTPAERIAELEAELAAM